MRGRRISTGHFLWARVSYTTRNRLDPSGGQQVKSTTKGDVDLRLLFAGFPAQEEAPEGELRMLGTIELSLQRVS